MNIKKMVANSLRSKVAVRFVEILNRQETEFRDALRYAMEEREESRTLLRHRHFTGIFEDYLQSCVRDDTLNRYKDRPHLVFSTDVQLTPQQENVLTVMSDWNVYAMVYNMEERCAAVLIRNAKDGRRVKNSTVETQSWGLVYPNGKVKISTRLPIASRGAWGCEKLLKNPPKETPASLIEYGRHVSAIKVSLKTGKFTIKG